MERQPPQKRNCSLIIHPPRPRGKLKPSKVPSLKVLFTNADQLTTNKMTELMKLVELEKPGIVAISEIKRKNTIADVHELKLPGFTLHQKILIPMQDEVLQYSRILQWMTQLFK